LPLGLATHLHGKASHELQPPRLPFDPQLLPLRSPSIPDPVLVVEGRLPVFSSSQLNLALLSSQPGALGTRPSPEFRIPESLPGLTIVSFERSARPGGQTLPSRPFGPRLSSRCSFPGSSRWSLDAFYLSSRKVSREFLQTFIRLRRPNPCIHDSFVGRRQPPGWLHFRRIWTRNSPRHLLENFILSDTDYPIGKRVQSPKRSVRYLAIRTGCRQGFTIVLPGRVDHPCGTGGL
jgi:hypothetical protein